MDAGGGRAARWTLPHSEAGITSTLRRLAEYGGPDGLRVAIETRKGLVVDRLLAAVLLVFGRCAPCGPGHLATEQAGSPSWTGVIRPGSVVLDSPEPALLRKHVQEFR